MKYGGIFLLLLQFVPFFYGIYLIVKGIMYFKSAEELEATVINRHIAPADNYGRVYYGLLVDVEDNGEIFTVLVEDCFRLKNFEHALKNGDKITVWYLKKSQKCIFDRSHPIKRGLIIIAVFVCIFLSMIVILGGQS